MQNKDHTQRSQESNYLDARSPEERAADAKIEASVITTTSGHSEGESWSGGVLVLAKEYARMSYLVSEENWPAHKESDAPQSLLGHIRQLLQQRERGAQAQAAALNYMEVFEKGKQAERERVLAQMPVALSVKINGVEADVTDLVLPQILLALSKSE